MLGKELDELHVPADRDGVAYSSYSCVALVTLVVMVELANCAKRGAIAPEDEEAAVVRWVLPCRTTRRSTMHSTGTTVRWWLDPPTTCIAAIAFDRGEHRMCSMRVK
jgi:hypothetical protein